MCGLVAFSSKDEDFNLEKIKTLIYISSIERGQDATGLYSPKNGLKKAVEGGWAYVTNDDNEIVPDKTLMAHVRAKTVGINNIKNAHPFERGNYVLIHNGTLKNHVELLRKYELPYSDYDVDSDMVTGCINKADSISDIIKQIDGAAAFIIHDKRKVDDNILYVFRNKERDLFRGFIGNSMYIASIESALLLIGCKDVELFDEDLLYTIQDGKILSSKKIKNVPFKEAKESFHGVCIGAMVRMKYDSSSKKNKKHAAWHLKKGHYYEIVKTIGTHYVLFDPESTFEIKVFPSMIELDDIPREEDYLMALFDVRPKNDPLHGTIVKKGDIIQVKSSWYDDDFTIKRVREVTFGYHSYNTVEYYRKKFFRKLTPTEKANFLGLEEEDTTTTGSEASIIPFQINRNGALAFPLQAALALEQATDPENVSSETSPIVTGDDNPLAEGPKVKYERVEKTHLTKEQLESGIKKAYEELDGCIDTLLMDLYERNAPLITKANIRKMRGRLHYHWVRMFPYTKVMLEKDANS